MAKESSVAPKERVNIVYKSQVGDAQEEVELPLKILMMGDYTGRADSTPLEDRKPINVDKSNFTEVMANQKLELSIEVSDKLSNEKDATLPISLKFQSLADFGPEGVVNQVPQLKQLLELRGALNALKGPLSNIPAFRKKIQSLLGDIDGRKKVMAEVGLPTEKKKNPPAQRQGTHMELKTQKPEAVQTDVSLLDQILSESKLKPTDSGYDVARRGVQAFVTEM